MFGIVIMASDIILSFWVVKLDNKGALFQIMILGMGNWCQDLRIDFLAVPAIPSPPFFLGNVEQMHLQVHLNDIP